MSTHNHVRVLRERASKFLQYSIEALERGEYDLSCFFAEQAVQLRLKSLILRIYGSLPRTHSMREILGILSDALDKLGYPKVEEIRRFVRENRSSLRLLEDAYTGGRYLLTGYSRLDSEECINIARRIIDMVDRIEREVFS